MRERGEPDRARLLALREAAELYRDDWLLRAEVDELLAPGAAAGAPAAGA
jgi:hypothetical protein